MIKDNLRAIATVKNLQSEQRKPNEDELEILKEFNGWGAMWQIFKPEHPQHEELKSLLTREEFEAANASILNAHYTDPDIVKAIWEYVNHLGFQTGKILEPSCGIGYFMTYETRPESTDWRAKSNEWTAIELDPIPGAIANYLNPQATIYNQGFEKVSLPDDYFDLAIGNVPFGSYSVFEPRYDGLFIHNHFISKSIDLVREGGLIALITSTGTLDAEGNKEFRRSLSEKATLLLGVRMPGGTMSNAKTQVTTDLLIFKKEPEPNARWIDTGEILGLPINQYFLDNLNLVLGEICKDKLYGGERLAVKSDGGDISSEIAEIVKSIKPCYTALHQNFKQITLVPRELQSVPVNAFCIWNEQLYQKVAGRLELMGWSVQIRDNLEILEIVQELLDRQLHQSDEELSSLRQKLNQKYDEFVGSYGYLSGDRNKAKMESDPRYGLLCSMDLGGNKAQIFTKRTTRGYSIPDRCGSAKDALLHCLNVKGKVDLDWIMERV